MNVLITGGAGYLGTELTYALEQLPGIREICIYDNLSRKNYNLFLGSRKLDGVKVRFVRGDILDTRKLKPEVEKADVVYHLAAKVTTPLANHDPHQFDQVNNWGTAELVYLAEQARVEKFIYASSTSVYGSGDQTFSLDSDRNASSFYGISKMHGENHVTRLLNSDTQTYILRLGNVYGYSKSMRFDSVINRFMFEANFNGRIKIFGDGNQRRSFIHVERLRSALAGFCREKPEEGTYNVVERTVSVNELVDALKQLYPELEMVFVNQNMPMRSVDVIPDERTSDWGIVLDSNLQSDLEQFRERFTF